MFQIQMFIIIRLQRQFIKDGILLVEYIMLLIKYFMLLMMEQKLIIVEQELHQVLHLALI